MTDKLPPNLLALFAARPPLRWVEPSDHAPEKRRTAPIGGVAAFLPELQKYKETDKYEPTESWLEMRDRKKRETKENVANLVTEGPKQCKDAKWSWNAALTPNFIAVLTGADSQTKRGSQHPWRCLQDSHCCPP